MAAVLAAEVPELDLRVTMEGRRHAPRLLPAPPTGAPRQLCVVRMPSMPERPVRDWEPDELASTLQIPVLPSEPAVVVVDAACFTGRPRALAAAAASAVLWGRAQLRGMAVIGLGDVGVGPRRLGIAPVPASLVDRELRNAKPGSATLLLDVDWAQAIRAFPHVHGLAADLVGLSAAVMGALQEALGRMPDDRPFRDQGLDSNGAQQVTARLQAVIGRPLDPDLLYRCPTVAQLVAHLSALPDHAGKSA
jgi:hypothetical protein